MQRGHGREAGLESCRRHARVALCRLVSVNTIKRSTPRNLQRDIFFDCNQEVVQRFRVYFHDFQRKENPGCIKWCRVPLCTASGG